MASLALAGCPEEGPSLEAPGPTPAAIESASPSRVESTHPVEVVRTDGATVVVGRVSLSFYALAGRRERPKPGGDAIVLPDVPSEEHPLFGARLAPDLTVMTYHATLAMVDRIERSFSKDARIEVRRLRWWLLQQRPAYVGFWLEPVGKAGHGTAGETSAKPRD